MIGSTLDFIVQTLNNSICQRLKLNPSANKVVLSSIVDPSGSISLKSSNVIVIKLVNIEPDPIANSSQPTVHFPTGSNLVEAAPLYLNLKIVLAAYFKPEQLQTGLDMLTMVISYLHSNQMWNAQNTPGLPDDVDRLFFEMESLDLHQLSHLWGAIGSKALPAAVYKIKMLTVTDHNVLEMIPNVIATDIKVE